MNDLQAFSIQEMREMKTTEQNSERHIYMAILLYRWKQRQQPTRQGAHSVIKAPPSTNPQLQIAGTEHILSSRDSEFHCYHRHLCHLCLRKTRTPSNELR